MALLEESLVEEYYRREGYFTIRGLKCGSKNKEIDLLCVKPNDSYLDCIHVEVHVSYKPVGYISKVSSASQKKFNCSKGAANRSNALLDACVTDWIASKYYDVTKDNTRKLLAPNSEWKFVFVCAYVKDNQEIELIEKKGIKIKSWESIVKEFIGPNKLNTAFSSDITDLLRYTNELQKHNSQPVK